MAGVVLEILHPKIASRSCESCKRWLYNDGPDGDGKVVERIEGHPEPRGRLPVPCETSVGCPKGHWSRRRSFSPRNRMAWDHYRAMRAVRVPTPDPLMAQNALIIENALSRIEEIRREAALTAVSLGAMRRVTNG